MAAYPQWHRPDPADLKVKGTENLPRNVSHARRLGMTGQQGVQATSLLDLANRSNEQATDYLGAVDRYNATRGEKAASQLGFTIPEGTGGFGQPAPGMRGVGISLPGATAPSGTQRVTAGGNFPHPMDEQLQDKGMEALASQDELRRKQGLVKEAMADVERTGKKESRRKKQGAGNEYYKKLAASKAETASKERKRHAGTNVFQEIGEWMRERRAAI